MSTTLNGWPGIPDGASPDLVRRVVPGTSRTVKLQRDAAPLFLAYLADWHKTVMPIDGAKTYLGPDGWEYREARSGDGLSCHAGGVAVDVRYDVLKADRRRHMTDAQQAAVRRLLDRYVDDEGRRVFGWGGDWHAVDEMHTELAQSWAVGARGRRTTAADVKAVISRLGIRPDGTIAPKTPPPAPWGGRPLTWATLQRAQLATAQRALKTLFPDVRVTGTFLPLVDAAYRRAVGEYQRVHPDAYKADGSRDGVVGEHLYASLVSRYYPA